MRPRATGPLALTHLTKGWTTRLFLFVLRRWTASGTSFAFVLTPFVTVAVGVWLAHETISWAFVVGGVLVLLGVYVGALAPARARTVRTG